MLIHPDARREAELTAAGGHNNSHPQSHAPHDAAAQAAHAAHAHGYRQPSGGGGNGTTHANPGQLFAAPGPSAPDLEQWSAGGGGISAGGGASGVSGQQQPEGRGEIGNANVGAGGTGGDPGESIGSGRSVGGTTGSAGAGKGPAKIGPAASFGRVAWKGMDASGRDGSGSGSGRTAS